MTPLEALRRLRDYENLSSCNPIAYLLEQDNLPIYYKNIESALKALEIIKEKEIDIWLLKVCDYDNYCRIRIECLKTNVEKMVDSDEPAIPLPTKEEYELLKEVLELL